MRNYTDNLGLITGGEDETGETDATGTGLAAGASQKLCGFNAAASRECIVTGLGVSQDPAGDGYITFSLRVNGIPYHPFHKIRSQIATLALPTVVHVPVPTGAKIEIWATNTHASTPFQCAGRVQAEYRDFNRPTQRGL